MKIYLYTVYDQKAQAFIQPFCFHNDALSIRVFTDSANDPENLINKHPEDFSLYRAGEFDPATGKIDTAAEPVLLVSGTSVHRPERAKLEAVS